MRKKYLILLPALLLSACASTSFQQTAVQPAEATERPASLRWARNSAEHRAVFLQTYAAATGRLSLISEGRASGTWAVILDADETVLDNSDYQQRRADLGLSFTPESWNAWVREKRAPALPGAAAFVRHVRDLGGRVVIVTNRDEEVCPETQDNLQRVGVDVDLVLCKPPGVRSKNARFEAVGNGTAHAHLQPMDVVMYLGDNIQDFPGLDQGIRAAPDEALAVFGDSYFVFPNPMYGSWERYVPE